MIDSNVALPRRSEIAADDYDPLPCRRDPFLQASCSWLEPAQQDREAALEVRGAWSGRAGTKSLRFFANAFAYSTKICG